LYEYVCVIVSEHDGDTLRADVDLGFGVWLHEQDFRLNRINAPEVTGIQKPLGQASLAVLAGMLPAGAQVTVRTTKDKLDKYGRMLGDFYLADGTCVNDSLVKQGFAKYYDGTGPKPV
jgi:micrococcal nuclease